MRQSTRVAKRARSGFTIIELLVVVIVIGILAAAGMAKYQDFAEVARKRTCTSNQSQIDKAVAIFSTQNTPIPELSNGLMYFHATWPGYAQGWSYQGTGVPAFGDSYQLVSIVSDPKLWLCPTFRSGLDKQGLAGMPPWTGAYVGACYGNTPNEYRSLYCLYYQGERSGSNWGGATAFWSDNNPNVTRRQYVWCGGYGGFNCPGPASSVTNRHTNIW